MINTEALLTSVLISHNVQIFTHVVQWTTLFKGFSNDAIFISFVEPFITAAVIKQALWKWVNSCSVVIVLWEGDADCLQDPPLILHTNLQPEVFSPLLLIFLLEVIDWKRNELFIGCKGNKLLF